MFTCFPCSGDPGVVSERKSSGTAELERPVEVRGTSTRESRQISKKPTHIPGLSSGKQHQLINASASKSTNRLTMTVKHESGTNTFAASGSPLFKEYLQLLGVSRPDKLSGPITAQDALLVIDMQNDFVPHHNEDNPHGGRFGVPEGSHIVRPCIDLIHAFADAGAYVAATRDYHPADHASFIRQGGPFPPHCVQGTKGAELLQPIAKALAQEKWSAPDRVDIAFKAMHEDVDSFAALPYYDGGEGRITTKGGAAEKGLPCMMGCTHAPWTGSLIVKQSSIQAALADSSGVTPIDMQAPPDMFAVLDDGKDRGLSNLQEKLKGKKRIFVCGLALDFCVLDTCLNAAGIGEVFMVIDAARAAHIPGVGQFGSGFLTEPKEVMRKLRDGRVKVVSVESLTGVAPSMDVEVAPLFPASLGPLPLNFETKVDIRLEKDRYHVHGESFFAGMLDRMAGGVHDMVEPEGVISPIVPLPDDWPGAPDEAVSFCWGYPMDQYRVELLKMRRSAQLMFLALSTSAKLQFCAYGGYLLLDARGKVRTALIALPRTPALTPALTLPPSPRPPSNPSPHLASHVSPLPQVLMIQSISPVMEVSERQLGFGAPQKWNPAFTPALEKAGRFQCVTLPFLISAGEPPPLPLTHPSSAPHPSQPGTTPHSLVHPSCSSMP